MSERLERCLAELRARGEGAFMPFVVVGDPDMPTSERLVDVLVGAGADVLEFGFAFSDPPADGPIIQAADARALAAGATTPAAFGFLERIRERHDQPIVLLLYYNLVLRYGVDRFYARAAAAGVDAILVADLPIEEAGAALDAADRHGIAPIFIGTELSSEARLRRIGERARGFLYAVARTGITGEQVALSGGLAGSLERMRRAVDLPLIAGFGISTPEQARAVLDAGADGVIAGSAIVRRIGEHLGDHGVGGDPPYDPRETMLREIDEFARAMKATTRLGSGAERG